MENLKASGLSHVDFHQLDVKEQTSIASYAKFIEAHFGKLNLHIFHSLFHSFSRYQITCFYIVVVLLFIYYNLWFLAFTCISAS